LLKVHDLLLKKKVNKRYWALVEGRWPKDVTQVNAQLYKNHRKSGERVVIVSDEGKPSETLFKPVKYFSDATLVEAMPVTGRTHQIRVHAAHAGHPIAGDEKYGNREFNKRMKSKGLKRLFLHSISLYCRLQEDPEAFIGICAPLDRSLARFCSLLN
jgi:23S rRNA pseudouridine955/2504/2580 synthase